MKAGPFRGSRAVACGRCTRNDLRLRYRRLFRDVYIDARVELTAATRARAAWLAMGPNATLAGLSAAAVFGTRWLDPTAPAEVVRTRRHTQAGIIVHTYCLDDDDVTLVDGMRVTTPARTAFDIARSRDAREAVPILDALLRATRTTPADVADLGARKPRMPGVRDVLEMLELVDPGAESPQESRLRLIVVKAGLPKPETQIEFLHLGVRVDMGWPEWKVALEYDGVQHWNDPRQRARDIERIELLEAEGWVVIRVSASMMRHPRQITERVRAKLRARGCPV